MYSVSTHTAQINGWVALSKVREDFSHSLADYEYECDLIEGDLRIDGNEVKPDVVLTSGLTNHSIVVDCKSKTLSDDQHRRYQDLENNPLTLLEKSDLSELVNSAEYVLELCYSSLYDISDHELIRLSKTAFVQFTHSYSGVLIENKVKFDLSTVASAFPINMDPDAQLPTEYYPFDIEQQEDYEQFVSSIIQSLLYTAMNDGTLDVEEVLREAHPNWDNISDEKQSRFLTETNKVIVRLKREGLHEFIENIADSEGVWKVHPQTATAIQDRMKGVEFVREIAKEADQTTLK